MINALFDLLGTFYQSGDFAQAEIIARSITQAIPDDIVSLQFLGLVYYRTRRRSQAMQVFDAVAGSAPTQIAAAGDDVCSRASAQCQRAASGHGSALAQAWYDLGLVLFRLGRFSEAISALQAAISARPNFGAARRAITRIARFSCRRQSSTANAKPRPLSIRSPN